MNNNFNIEGRKVKQNINPCLVATKLFMSKFVVKSIESVRGKQEFKQLVILNDDVKIPTINAENEKGQLDIYEEKLQAKYRSSFLRIISIMNAVANLEGTSETQWKDVTPDKELVKEYEIKAGDLRAFAIKITNGKLLILGGYKNQQPSDFKRFRSLKKLYLESLKNTNNDQGRTTKK